MRPDDYVRLAMRTECDQGRARTRYTGLGLIDRLLPVRLMHGCIGITKEGGELLSLLEKWLHYGADYTETTLRDQVKDELGDVLWYAALVCSAAGLSMEEVMEGNLRKLRARYPDRYTNEAAASRDRTAEAAALHGPYAPSVLPGPASAGPALDDEGRPAPHPSHDWYTPSQVSSVPAAHQRCRRCGAYRHLGSGFFPCPVAPLPGESPAPDEAWDDGTMKNYPDGDRSGT